jgi:DNA-binding NarL/FixJ family response regulator
MQATGFCARIFFMSAQISATDSDTKPLSALERRRVEVLERKAKGEKNIEIAEAMGIHRNTVAGILAREAERKGAA